MKAAITPKQKRVLDYLVEFTTTNGYAPSQAEIAKHFGYSSLGTVQNYLVRLERAGLLKKEWNSRRGIAATRVEPTSEAISLPLSGLVAAGLPIEAIETNDTLDVPASMIRGAVGKHFVLKVSGDSMINDGILNGDYVVIRKQGVAQNGQTVVALIDNEATIKRYFRKDGTIELHAANPHYKPIVVDGRKDFHIEGVLVGLIRRWS